MNAKTHMIEPLHTFVGCHHIATFIASRSDACDKTTVIKALAEIKCISHDLLAAVLDEASQQQLECFLDEKVHPIQSAVQTIRCTSLGDQLDDTLVYLMESFYRAADELTGRGGHGQWPDSAGSL